MTPGQRFDDGGVFHFVNPGNPDANIQMINGCGSNNRYWVISGGTSVNRYLVTVTDTRTGTTKIYVNSEGTPAQPALTDTNAFATCP